MERAIRCWAIWLTVAGLGASAVSAQEPYTFTAALAGGLAGTFDSDEGGGFDQLALQGSVGMFTTDRTMTVLRVGRVSFDSQQAVAGRFDAELDFANVAGEYRFRQAAYDYGFFFGVGAYRIAGIRGGAEDDETALGAALGFTGDFDLTRRLSIVAEVDVHYAFFDDAEFYGAGLAGVAIHF